MDHQSAAPGPEVGWGVGLVGFIASVLLGWVLDAGVGFVLFLMVFWGGIGALFAFLVERSTIEEYDRVDELQNTRLGTLAPAPGAVAGPSPRSYREDDASRPTDREAPSRGSATALPERRDGAAPRVAPSPRGSRDAAPTAPGPDPRSDGSRPRRPPHDRPYPSPAPAPVAATMPRSPREYREAKIEASRRDHSAA